MEKEPIRRKSELTITAPARTCPSGKMRYLGHTEAHMALRRKKRQNTLLKPVRAYRCPSCEGFHLTSTPERKKW